jgi:hypothetical protein
MNTTESKIELEIPANWALLPNRSDPHTGHNPDTDLVRVSREIVGEGHPWQSACIDMTFFGVSDQMSELSVAVDAEDARKLAEAILRLCPPTVE